MNKHYFTIGMAGHIDHGKTELVKALTGVDTDRLKEEKERKISIELGYAPLIQNEETNVSIIDVPGHEKFIRQMIAGVSSIDLTLLVIAADEGIMPQTIEHVEILNYLNVKNGLVVLTKIDQVDEELISLVKEEVYDLLEGTVFENKPMFEVSSINGRGIKSLKDEILLQLKRIQPKENSGSLFLPIDQSFQIHGIGTVVRGTLVEGTVNTNDQLVVMPSRKEVQVKSIQQFNQSVKTAYAGQRAALSLRGIHANEVQRGSVVTNNVDAKATDRVDIELKVSDYLTSVIKQRAPIKLHTGTNEVFGKIIFYDRNKLEEEKGLVYAQLELEHPIFVLKDQYYVLRRATPIETIGGGRIIEPYAEKHKHGQKTVDELKQKSTFDEQDYILNLVTKNPGITSEELNKLLNYSPNLDSLTRNNMVMVIDQKLFSKNTLNQIKNEANKQLRNYHKEHPLLLGMNKSELVSKLPLTAAHNKSLVQHFIEEGIINQIQNYIRLPQFEVQPNDNQERVLNQVINDMKKDGLIVNEISYYLNQPSDFILFLVQQNYITQLTEKLYIETTIFNESIDKLYQNTHDSFTLKEAKEVLNVSRKYLIPFLEKLDQLKHTKRKDNQRVWLI